MVLKAAFFNIFGDIRILQIFYNRLIILKIIGFCCIEWEVGVLSDLSVNGKVKVYQLWENKSVPPRGKKLVPMRVELSYHHLPVDQNV